MKFREELLEAGFTENEIRRGCFLGGGGGGGQTSTNTVQKADPWAGQQPFLEDIYERSKKAAEITPSEPFSGQYVARPTTTQREAVAGAQGIAQANVGLGQPTLDLAQGTLAGDYLNANQYLAPAISAAMRPSLEQMTDVMFPALGTEAQKAGAYGGTDQDWAKIRLADKLSQNLMDAGVQAAAANFQNERRLQMLAPGLAQAGYQMELAPFQTLQATGTTMQGWEQDLINEALAQYQAEAQAPWQPIFPYSSVVMGSNPGGTTTTTGVGTTPQPSAMSGALGGALMGGLGGWGAAEMGLGTALGLSNPWIIGGGALLGGLLGMM